VWTLRRYLPALAWAAVFAIALWPLYESARRRWPPGRHDVLLPAAFTAAVALVFLGPLALVAVQVGHEAHAVAAWVRETQAAGAPVPGWISGLPLVGGRAASWWQANLGEAQGPSELVRRLDSGGQAMAVGRTFGAALLHRAVLFGFTLLTLFFLFRDGTSVRDQMLAAGRRAFGPAGERVGRQVIASVRGTVDGLVLVGLGEGALLGVAYAVAGVPHPVLLGALTAVAAMVPFGAPLAFGIAALLLLAKGAAVAAGVLLAFGFVVTFAADHAVRPVLIGGATRLPFLWVLLGILGGVETWGLLGLFLGPAIMAALILLWREWTGGAAPG
jgi:predicted PurR-regulated permease PerM